MNSVKGTFLFCPEYLEPDFGDFLGEYRFGPFWFQFWDLGDFWWFIQVVLRVRLRCPLAPPPDWFVRLGDDLDEEFCGFGLQVVSRVRRRL